MYIAVYIYIGISGTAGIHKLFGRSLFNRSLSVSRIYFRKTIIIINIYAVVRPCIFEK